MENNNANTETLRTFKSLESVMGTMLENMEAINKALTGKSDAFYENFKKAMLSSLSKNDAERRSLDAAQKQHDEVVAANRKSAGPDRNDPDYYDKLFAPTPKSQADIYSEAIRKAMSDNQTRQTLRGMLSSSTIKEATGSNIDSRTTPEKLLDKVGLGGINRLTKWFQDRDVRSEQKATRKDQVEIKRGMEEIPRLAAKYRKMQDSGASQEKLDALMEKMNSKVESIKSAEARIDYRRRDPYADLVEMGSIKQAGVLPGKAMPEANGNIRGVSGVTDVDKLAAALKSKMGADRSDKGPGGVDKIEMATLDRTNKLKSQKFYDIGADFFEKATKGELDGSGGGLPGIGNMPGTSPNGPPGPLTVAAAGALIPIVKLVEGLYELGEVTSTAGNNVRAMADANNKNREDMKVGWNDSYLTAEQDYAKAKAMAFKSMSIRERSLAGSDESYDKYIRNSIRKLSINQNLTDEEADKIARGKLAPKIIRDYMEARDRQKAEAKRREEFLNAAHAKGIKTQDTDAMNEFYQEYFHTPVKPGKDTNATPESKANKAAGKNDASDIEVKPADNAPNPNPEQPTEGTEKVHEAPSADSVKMAAGSLEQSAAPNTKTPGAETNVENMYTFTLDVAKIEEATYQGTKRAMLDHEVQAKNEELAKAQGREINDRLVGGN